MLQEPPQHEPPFSAVLSTSGSRVFTPAGPVASVSDGVWGTGR